MYLAYYAAVGLQPSSTTSQKFPPPATIYFVAVLLSVVFARMTHKPSGTPALCHPAAPAPFREMLLEFVCSDGSGHLHA
jgi:hypothetical protein